MRFEDAPFSENTRRAVAKMGFVEMTPIQEQAIAPAIEGRDIIGQAATGTGKTAAFVIPFAETLKAGKHVQALVLCPTRELAMQVAEQAYSICDEHRLRCIAVFGGQPIVKQIRTLEQGVEIVIGTPGRLLDHLRRGTLDLSHVRICVLDEADEMLDMGFYPDIVSILRRLPRRRQTMLFSATMPIRIRRIASRYMTDPVEISLNTERMTVAQTSQVFYELDEHEKLDGLCRLLDAFNFELTLAFCRTKYDVDRLARALLKRGYNALALHGDLNQSQRNHVMKQFRDGNLEVLVATDIAARGLDVEGITHVVNYNLPQDPERYVHRIGRTGRAGKEGAAITFVTPREYYDLMKIQETANVQIWQEYLPTEEEIMDYRVQELRDLLDGALEEEELTLFQEAIDELAEDYPLKDIAAGLLNICTNRYRQPSRPPEAKASAASSGRARLFVTIGKKDGLKPKAIAQAISDQANIPNEVIGRVDMKETFTFVEVPVEDAEKVINALHESVIEGREVKVQHAKKKKKRSPQRG